MNMQRIASMLALVAALLVPAAPVAAQARSNVQGKIDEVMLDEQYIVIDGERLTLREADLTVTWKGEPLRPTLLQPGMAIFFSTHDDGSIRSITLIGPAEILEQLNAH